MAEYVKVADLNLGALGRCLKGKVAKIAAHSVWEMREAMLEGVETVKLTAERDKRVVVKSGRGLCVCLSRLVGPWTEDTSQNREVHCDSEDGTNSEVDDERLMGSDLPRREAGTVAIEEVDDDG